MNVLLPYLSDLLFDINRLLYSVMYNMEILKKNWKILKFYETLEFCHVLDT